MVVRALPQAAKADHAKLSRDFGACIDKVLSFSGKVVDKP
jgi:hypothetical protein